VPKDSTFWHLPRPEPHALAVTFSFEGAAIAARTGDTVASALLATGHNTFRTSTVSGSARGPFCMMGACFECLVEIDGISNRQACMIQVRAGMIVRRMAGARSLAGDAGDV
jgi:predicted molibdopterin-dependent oxidoreductase YjgC